MTRLSDTAEKLSSSENWSPRRLLGAPHRLGFAVGAALMGLLALWWLAVLAAMALGLDPGWAVPPAPAHGLLFTLGFMPAFMAGFLFTAGPRWLALPAVAARTLLAPLLQFGAGWATVLAGVHAAALLAALGMALVAVGWLRLLLRFAALLRASRAPDRLHARWLLAAGAIGVAAMLLACRALARGDVPQLRAAAQLGLWAFVLPVFTVAWHRMIPLFAATALPRLEALGERAQLLLLLAGPALMGLARVPGLPRWPLAALLALAALALLALALRWRPPAGDAGRLLRMLRGGFGWLGVALALQALSLGLQAVGRAGLGTAPLHALTLGYLGCTLVAMATRVAAAHSGRPLAIDRAGWRLYRLLQLGVLLRLAAAPGLGGGAALLAAAAAWAGVATAWAWRQGRWLGLPRADGRAG
ncbi:NnrS family protein [Pelomonas aquatica]|uniref:NnrS family protein n=1 Tax=Pelomonas aquatica TaxID=431058 RepID=UPI00227B9A02|nr:NnrS family protein [Pelomonas aquatica]MCY4756294.1 NnrS family protein [Pelomonas aquatica]